MKATFWSLFLAALFGASIVGCSQTPLQWQPDSGPDTKVLTMFQDGSRLIWAIPRERMEATVHWSPEDGPPQLSIADAVKLGTASLRTRYPYVKGFAVRKIGLDSFFDPRYSNAVWYYVVDCVPILSAGVERDRRLFYAVVMLDGFVIEPTKSK